MVYQSVSLKEVLMVDLMVMWLDTQMVVLKVAPLVHHSDVLKEYSTDLN